jgi:hypothetical protein
VSLREGMVMCSRIIPVLVIVAASIWSDASVTAIAPSKLGQFIYHEWSSDEVLLGRLREAGLVRLEVSDEKLMAVFEKVRREHSATSVALRNFNSPEERVRVFLEPYLTDKGRLWAVPLASLELPDE